MSDEKLRPASDRDVSVYMPYYQGRKRSALPYAISLYQRGNLEGQRTIEGGESIPFVATWHVSSLPADLTRCRLQFDGSAELSYEVTLANFEFVDYLIDVLFNMKAAKLTDFSQAFYRKLLRYDD
ncbi:MAG: type IV pilus biogenesis protein EbsA [Elainellaceae cyanobacterium]